MSNSTGKTTIRAQHEAVKKTKEGKGKQVQITPKRASLQGVDTKYLDQIKSLLEPHFEQQLDKLDGIMNAKEPDLSKMWVPGKAAVMWLQWHTFKTNAERAQIHYVVDLGRVLSGMYDTPIAETMSEKEKEKEAARIAQMLENAKRNTKGGDDDQ